MLTFKNIVIGKSIGPRSRTKVFGKNMQEFPDKLNQLTARLDCPKRSTIPMQLRGRYAYGWLIASGGFVLIELLYPTTRTELVLWVWSVAAQP